MTHFFPKMTANCRRTLGIIAVALLAMFGSSCAHSSLESRAELKGCLWYVTPSTNATGLDLDANELDSIQALGMNLVILNGPWIGRSNATSEDDPAEKLFAEGDQRGMEFFVGTGAMPQWWTLANPDAELARAHERIALLQRRYGHHRSFRGFYVPYETYVMWGTQRELVRTLYQQVAAACKTVAPKKQVMISPFFILDEQQVLGDFRWATPREFENFWSDVLKDSAIDIVALQDRGEHLSCYTDEQCAPFFAAMHRACAVSGKALWANVESGELLVDSPADFVARFGLKTHVNDPRTQPYWRGITASKLAAKLRFVRAWTPTAITWGYREFIRPRHGPKADQLYDEYRAMLATRAGLVQSGKK